MPQMMFDLLDGKPPVSLMLSAKDAERFAYFMGECYADQTDAARYRELKRGAMGSVIDGKGDELRAWTLDAAADAAVDARKGVDGGKGEGVEGA